MLALKSHALVVALTRSESVYLWSANDYGLVACLQSADGERKGFVAACVSSVHPFLFFARHGSRVIQVNTLRLVSSPLFSSRLSTLDFISFSIMLRLLSFSNHSQALSFFLIMHSRAHLFSLTALELPLR